MVKSYWSLVIIVCLDGGLNVVRSKVGNKNLGKSSMIFYCGQLEGQH